VPARRVRRQTRSGNISGSAQPLLPLFFLSTSSKALRGLDLPSAPIVFSNWAICPVDSMSFLTALTVL